MKRNRVVLSFILTILFACYILNIPKASAEDTLSIDVLPETILFEITNMKPGDWAPRTAVVQNNGEIEFEYITSVQPNSESLKLYNELILEVTDDNIQLYNGKLSDFNGVSPRELQPGEEDELEFIVRFPEHLGNDFQGLEAEFTIFFKAESDYSEQSEEEEVTGSIDSGDESGGLALPSTATNIFNYLLVGLILLVTGTVIGLFFLYNRKLKSIDKL
ncbi:hypothetical protein [Oceanobacillus bengalensis]|uniref:LPXTG cell wall anchor domain-containing protein n=1 Tax=Oceanobacillus bengalensis TaxID=1435466 RepID=A0A494Z6Q9_9BACI|nr:hypothetical protein [Oceanobacillus bengalensis]RKQ18204.1 hypothetical protein D8M05_02020 [Oceanobacillus bengalensis]